jgi:transposase
MYSRSAPRRRHGVEFKAKVLAACDEPGASIAGVALAHGLNANLVRQWRAGRGAKFAHGGSEAVVPSKAARTALTGASPEFVSIEMPIPPKSEASTAVKPSVAPTATEPLIQVELRRGQLHLNVRWPASASGECTAWLRELSSGLLK